MEFTIENLMEVLSDYFQLNEREGSYTYELTRVKSAFSVGTMTMEDFEEWGDVHIDDLATHLWDKFKR
ncbi:hypothetical protein [Bacillus infantis]|uniref:hypothetical protein n=1 Tax=Bacillus infantis TaxID=324767 RepID=UPI003CF8F1A3